MTEENRQKLEIDWLRTVAGALAAVSSAVLLSTLGAAGTIVGAALGSVIATVGGAVYSAGLAHSRERLAEAQNVALRKVGVAQAEVRRASRRQGDDEAVEAHLAHADARLAEAREDLDVIEPADPGWGERFAGLPWRRIALVAAGLFAASVLTITAFELVAGESVSSITGGTDDGGGTTVSHLGGSDGTTPQDEHDDEKAPSDTVSETASPTDTPSPEGSPTTQPTEEPSESPSESPSAPTPTPLAPTSSVEPSPSPSAQ